MLRYLLPIFFLTPTLIFAQDLLLFENGEEKKVNIIEITPVEVKYKMEGNILYTVYKEDLVGVVLENGTFEKFDDKKRKQFINRDACRQHNLNIDLFQPFLGNIEMGYEIFNESGSKSIKLPLLVRLWDPEINDLDAAANVDVGSFMIGFERRYYPRGSQGVVKGFLGWGHDFGVLLVRSYIYDYYNNGDYHYSNNSYYFGEALFVGGMLVQASDLINFSLNGKIGGGLINLEQGYLAIRLNLSLGFRF